MPDETQAGSGASNSQQQTPQGAPAAPGAPATPPASGATPPVPGATEPVSNPEAKRYADEAAAERTARKHLEVELKKLQDAQLTDAQKRERDYTDLQTKAVEQELRLQQQGLRLAAYDQASALNISDIRAAVALVQSEHGTEIKYSATGEPENIAELLKAVLKDHPILGQSAGARQPAPTAGGATNPGRQAGNGGLTLDQIKAMSPRERVRRINEIKAWEDAQRQEAYRNS